MHLKFSHFYTENESCGFRFAESKQLELDLRFGAKFGDSKSIFIIFIA